MSGFYVLSIYHLFFHVKHCGFLDFMHSVLPTNNDLNNHANKNQIKKSQVFLDV